MVSELRSSLLRGGGGPRLLLIQAVERSRGLSLQSAIKVQKEVAAHYVGLTQALPMTQFMSRYSADATGGSHKGCASWFRVAALLSGGIWKPATPLH